MAWSDAPVIVRVTDEERAAGKLERETLEQAVVALLTDGLVVLENATDLAHIDLVNERMTSDALKILADSTVHRNFAETGNVSQVPPIEKEFLLQDIFANRLATEVLSSVLGPFPVIRYAHGNNATKGIGRQPVHADLGFDPPPFPFGIVSNTLFVDATEENGATEIWLGTQNSSSAVERHGNDAWIAEEFLAARRLVRPPVRAVVKRGSVILRDLRLWHAGIANTTEVPRIMTALVHFPAWYPNKLTIDFPESLRERVEELQAAAKLTIAAHYVPDEGYDYLKLKFNADFSPRGGHEGVEYQVGKEAQ